jgi:AsmA protein
LAAQKTFFRMSDVADTAFDFDSINFDATFANGSAEVHDAKIIGRNETVTLSGLVPYRSNALALSGSLEAADPANAGDLPLLPFFIGGTWPDPVISPVSTLLQKPTQP